MLNTLSFLMTFCLVGCACLFTCPLDDPPWETDTASHLWCNSNTCPPLRKLTATGHPLPVTYNQAMPSRHVHHLCHSPAHLLTPLLVITLLSRDPSLSPPTSLDLTPPPHSVTSSLNARQAQAAVQVEAAQVATSSRHRLVPPRRAER